jgi:hypothetical protein
MNKLVWGIGVNDLCYRTQINEEVTKNGGKRIREIVFICKYYTAWINMLKRCYSKKSIESRPSYIDASVCNEWLSATAFKKWMEKQDWRDKCLDKDIIVPGSKLYSPETCAFCGREHVYTNTPSTSSLGREARGASQTMLARRNQSCYNAD